MWSITLSVLKSAMTGDVLHVPNPIFVTAYDSCIKMVANKAKIRDFNDNDGANFLSISVYRKK